MAKQAFRRRSPSTVAFAPCARSMAGIDCLCSVGAGICCRGALTDAISSCRLLSPSAFQRRQMTAPRWASTLRSSLPSLFISLNVPAAVARATDRCQPGRWRSRALRAGEALSEGGKSKLAICASDGEHVAPLLHLLRCGRNPVHVRAVHL